MSLTSSRKTAEVWEFGDFQTPDKLAVLATQVISELGLEPSSIIEPTCGVGAFLLAAITSFPGAEKFIGVDINRRHLDELRSRPIHLAIMTVI